jgi:hypothetical protein
MGIGVQKYPAYGRPGGGMAASVHIAGEGL